MAKEDKRMELLNQFLSTFERLLDSDLPNERKLANIEALYIAYCTAVGKKPNYEILNNL